MAAGYVRDDYLVFEITQVPFFDTDGRLLGTIGSGRDITRQKDRINDIQYALNVGFMEWNLISNKVFFSDRLKADLGYEPDEIKNKFEEWKKRIHPDDSEKALLAHNLFSERDTTRVNLEYRLLHRDKTYRWFKSNTICRRNVKNNPFILSSFLTDINEEKKAERRLVEMNTELGNRIAHQDRSIEKNQSVLKLLMEKHAERKKDISNNSLSNLKGLVLQGQHPGQSHVDFKDE